MQMGMQMQVLSPGVKHGKPMWAPRSRGSAADSSKAVLRCGTGSPVNLFRVLKRQAIDLSGQREHDVEIRDSQKLGFALRQRAGTAVAATPGQCRLRHELYQDDAMSAPIALLNASAEGSSPAVANVAQGFPLLARESTGFQRARNSRW